MTSTFALLLATIDCFLLLQVKRFSYTYEEYPNVKCLPDTSLAQSTYKKISTSLVSSFLYSCPFHGVIFRYLKILFIVSMCFSIRLYMN